MRRIEVAGHRQPQCWQPFVRAALGAAVVASASGLHAAGLFLPVDSADAASGSVAAAKSVSERHDGVAAPTAWERRVRIALRELTVARDAVEGAGAGRLRLDVRDSLSLDVVVERTAPTKWGYSLSGRATGGNVGFVTMVVHEEAVAGTIWTPNSAYEIEHMEGGVHTLREVTNAQPVSCAAGTYSDVTPAGALARSGDDDGSVVDILIVWTPAYEERSGGPEDVLLHIEMLIAHINDAFDRSGALVSLNLVGAQKLDEDSFLSIDGEFSRLVNPNDGYWDDVHDWRDALGADLVHMLTTALGNPQAGGAFGIAGHHPRVFAHEIGHNMGLRHERAEIDESAGGLGGPMSAYDYGFSTGFRDPTNRDARDCGLTFMSYGNRCGGDSHYLPFYASPWRYHPEDGRPLGVSRFSRERGIRGPADAVLAINRNRHIVANLRHKP